MAKKKRRIVEEPKEEYEFTPEAFNEREFVLKDLYGSKVFMVTVVLAILVGVVTGIICNLDIAGEYDWVIATLLSFLVLGLNKKILTLLGFRPEMIEGKTMVGNYLVYLAMTLGICIIMVNPPFSTLF